MARKDPADWETWEWPGGAAGPPGGGAEPAALVAAEPAACAADSRFDPDTPPSRDFR
jgi:hypothetical protein